MTRLLVPILLALLALAHAQTWTVEIATGTSVKAPNTLTISQDGFGTVEIPGTTYETRPWVPYTSLVGLTENYYSVRVGYRPENSNTAFEVEWLHDKAYFISGQDPDHVVWYYDLSDGLNSLFFNVAYVESITDRLDLVGRIGGGVSIPNPATIIRGGHSGTREHMGAESTYYLGGFSANIGLQARYYLIDNVALTSEIRYVYSPVSTPIYRGKASGLFHGVHFNFGVLFSN